ncbi:MAG TPA: hypothetical protein VF213_10940 [Dongiaceae bacterium]
MGPEKRPTPPLAPPQRAAVLSRIELLGLILGVVLGFLFALPAMKDTYTGAVLSGKCERDPKSVACRQPPNEQAMPGHFA